MKKNSDIVEQIHLLEMNGKHAQAMTLASQELSQPDISPVLQMKLLSLRISAYIIQEKLEEAYQDIKLMETLAKKSRVSSPEHFDELSAMAYASHSRYHSIQGKNKEAYDLAKKALKHAKRSGQKELICSCTLTLGHLLTFLGDLQSALELTQKGIALAQELGDLVQLAAGYLDLRLVHDDMGLPQPEQQIVTLNRALKSSDLFNIGRMYNMLGSSSDDLALAITYIKKSVEVFTTYGSVRNSLIGKGNLAYTYTQLGLFSLARRLYSQTFTHLLHRDYYSEAIALSNLITIEVATRRLKEAQAYLQQFGETVPLLNSEFLNSYFLSARGNVAFLAGEYSKAIQHYTEALELARAHKYYREHEMLIEIAKVHLIQGNFKKALASTTEAVKIHEEASYAPTGNSSCPNQRIWWLHTQALQANQRDKEASTTLEHSYDFLLERVKNIRDVGLRRSYLNKIADNRALLQLWLSEGRKRKLPRERLYAYLNIESNTREPFARLTDTSQRLNLLKDIPEIQTFLVDEATELSGGERVMLILEDGKKFEVAEANLPVGEEADKVLLSIKKHLTQARLTRTVQLILPQKSGLSRIIAPLIAQNQVFGYLYADMDFIYGLFDDTDRDMLGMLANQAAVALDNAGLVTGLEQKVSERTAQLQASVNHNRRLLKESRTLATVGREISSSLETRNVLENIAAYAKDLLNGEASALFIAESDGKTLKALVGTEGITEELQNTVLQLGATLLGSIIANKAGEIINNIVTPNADGTVAALDTPRHLLAVPLSAENQALGLMAVWRSGEGREFHEHELSFLHALSRQAAIALKNAQLFALVQEARTAAEQANRTKSAFLANMSHELRTPLNSIINFTELVTMEAMGPVTPDQQEALGHSLSSSKHLLQLINDVLDISKIQAGKLSLFMEEQVDIKKLINETLAIIEPSLQKQNELYANQILLIRDVDPDLPPITCDQRRVKQVLLNLLSNAIKFTEQGSVTLSVKHHREQLTFAVMDTGPGIAFELQAQVFEPFVQTLDGVKQAEGTGLGLPITKSLVEAHGGQMWLESAPGEGSAFFFTLPVESSS